ncbi:MAG: S8 family serine peptidase [candidate division WOR-3 bacterium]
MKFILILVILDLKITPSLREILNNSGKDEKIPVIVHMREKPDYERIKNFPEKEYVEFIKKFSENSQKDILNYLKNFSDRIEEIKNFWIFNGFYLKATKDVIEAIAEREDVEYIIEDFLIEIEKPFPSNEILTPEWNIIKVKADSCWMEGYTGEGIIVGDLSSGVDTSHPALRGKFEGHWYDAVNGLPYPYDDVYIGTFGAGVILGGDGFGPFEYDIGIAPDAKFVACKMCNQYGSCPSSGIHLSFQKIAEWKSEGVNIRAINVPLASNPTSLEFWQDCLNLKNLGIISVFRIGNGEPTPGSASAPGNYPIVIGVGATDINDNIASFSQRGPAPNQYPWNNPVYWPRPDWNRTKPDISAPGVNVKSSMPGGGYGTFSGTGMATPHVTGAIAILLSKNPYLNFYEIYQILTDYAYHPPQGQPYPNNNYGWGRLDIYKALKNTPYPNLPFIFIESHLLEDENGNGIWEPGESASIILTLKNTGADANNVNGILRTNSNYINIQDSISNFGNILHNGTGNNSSDPYIVIASQNAPQGGVLFEIFITADNGYSKIDSFIEIIGPAGQDFVDHNCGNILLTVTKWGSIGYLASTQAQGNGCKYPITDTTKRLFYGGFAIGTQMPYVIDRYYEANGIDDDDWKETAQKVWMNEPYPPFSEYSVAKYSDSLGEQIKGIICKQRGYAWNDPDGDDFIILEFVLKNCGIENITGLYAGIFLDWDISTSTYFDSGSVDGIRKMAYQYYGNIYIGSAILNPQRTSPLVRNYTMIRNDQYVYPYIGLPDSIEIKFLNGTIFYGGGGPTDYSTCISAGPFDIPVSDSVIVAFAIAGGIGIEELRKNVDTAYARYWGFVEKKESELKRKNIFVPVFCKRLIMDKNATLKIYNVLGQRIKVEKIFNDKKLVELSKLKKGIYFIRINEKSYKSIVIK